MRLLRLTLLSCFLFFPPPCHAADDPTFPTIHELMKRLESNDILDSQDAALALGKRGPAAEEAIAALTEALKRQRLFRSAAFALAAIGPKGIPSLLESLQRNREKRDERYWLICEVLAKTSARAVPGLLDELSQADGNYFVMLRQRREFTRDQMIFGSQDIPKPSVLTLPFLIRALKHDNWKDRLLAAEALARLGPLARPAVSVLLEALEDEWPLEDAGGYGGLAGIVGLHGVRASAVKALLAIGPAAEERLLGEGLPRLITGVGRGTAATRRHTAHALALLGPRAKPAIPALLEQFSELRSELGRNVDAEGGPFVEALVAIGPDSIPAAGWLLRCRDPGVRRCGLSVLRALTSFAQRSLPLVLPLVRDGDSSVRYQAAETLVALDPDGVIAVPALAALLQDEESWVSIHVLQFLEEFGPRARFALPALRKAMNSPDTEVAAKAIDLIIQWDGPTKETTSRLQELLTPKYYITNVHFALARSGAAARAAIPALLQTLDSADPDDALAGAWVLSKIGGTEARRVVSAIIRVLNPKPKPDRIWIDNRRRNVVLAAKILQEFGPASREAVPALLALLASPELDGASRAEITGAMERMRGDVQTIRPLLEQYLEDEEKLPWASDAAAQLDPDGPHTIPALLAVLCYPNTHHRRSAAYQLGRLGPRARKAIPRLEQALEDDDEAFRCHAALALIKITGKKDPYADVLIRDLHRNAEAAYALALLPADSTWAIALLVEALSQSSTEIQTAAACSLTHFGPASQAAVPLLIKLLKEDRARKWEHRNPNLSGCIVSALGAIGAAAKDAVPLLREMRLGTDRWLFPRLEKALWQIEGEKGNR